MHSTNPFLQMLAAIGDEDDIQQQQPGGSGAGGGLQQQQPRQGKVQLGDFWPQAPNAWFAAAELKFEVANITSETLRGTVLPTPSALWASACCELSWTW